MFMGVIIPKDEIKVTGIFVHTWRIVNDRYPDRGSTGEKIQSRNGRPDPDLSMVQGWITFILKRTPCIPAAGKRVDPVPIWLARD
jgi:hypothetical protein